MRHVKCADCLSLSGVVTRKMFLLLIMNPRRPHLTMKELTGAPSKNWMGANRRLRRMHGKYSLPTAKRKKPYQPRQLCGAASGIRRNYRLGTGNDASGVSAKPTLFRNVLILSVDLLLSRNAEEKKAEGKRAPKRRRGRWNRAPQWTVPWNRAPSLSLRPSRPLRVRL